MSLVTTFSYDDAGKIRTSTFVYDDGGRSTAGFLGETGDCVTRAIAIALQRPYEDVYRSLNERAAEERPTRGKRSSARTGVWRATYQQYLESHGWRWTPTMKIRSGLSGSSPGRPTTRGAHHRAVLEALGGGRRRGRPRYPRSVARRHPVRLRVLLERASGTRVPAGSKRNRPSRCRFLLDKLVQPS